MKYTKVLVVLGLMAALAPSAFALTVNEGPQNAKFIDHTSLYRFNGTTWAPVPYPTTSGFVPILAGDENRAIFNATTLYLDTLSPVTEMNNTPGTATTPGVQLSGMFYDLVALGNYPAPAPGNPTTAFYGAGSRNPIPGAPAGTGGALEIYLDEGTTPTMTNYSAAAGAGAWVEGLAGARDNYPTVNQSGEPLWLQLAFIPFPGAGIFNPPGAMIKEVLDVQGTSYGEGYAMVVGGSFAPNVKANGELAQYMSQSGGFAPPPGLRADMYIKFSINPSRTQAGVGPGLWLARGDDPALFSAIPEPITVLSALMGIGGLAGYLRKRKMA